MIGQAGDCSIGVNHMDYVALQQLEVQTELLVTSLRMPISFMENFKH